MMLDRATVTRSDSYRGVTMYRRETAVTFRNSRYRAETLACAPLRAQERALALQSSPMPPVPVPADCIQYTEYQPLSIRFCMKQLSGVATGCSNHVENSTVNLIIDLLCLSLGF